MKGGWLVAKPIILTGPGQTPLRLQLANLAVKKMVVMK
jgi:hypothetical protein